MYPVKLVTLFLSVVWLLSLGAITVRGVSGPGAWPYTPWSTNKAQVKNARGETVTIVGANWPGAGETMLPEGLQYSSARSIVERLAQAGFNFVRHTYATQMIDEIEEGAVPGKDVTLAWALKNGLGLAAGTNVLAQVLKNNPQWTAETPRMKIWSDIANLERDNGIMMHLDNHVSKPMWCCSNTDGNAFFGDRYFDIARWTRGLSKMARWAIDHPNVASMSLRNELRPVEPATAAVEYSWTAWASNVTAGANAIHTANNNLLITISGLSYDLTLAPITRELDLSVVDQKKAGTPPVYFRIDDHAWHEKAVLELHSYDHKGITTPCDIIEANLYNNGFNALGITPPLGCASGPTSSTVDPTGKVACYPAKRLTPVWLTEFGQKQTDPILHLNTCLRDFTVKHKIGWAMWAAVGSYYTRQNTADFDETWGLFTHDWSAWRNQTTFTGWWMQFIQQMSPTNVEKPQAASPPPKLSSVP
ncbi:glycoside hydrolase [Acaromyces ingoldii]|uniref:Glycoside hydrolase n=1 Tax=Acaromyces ingoldii TaxID=215250 RepID=A0A316YM62_9BASI|nr:glycoside hydrolase [Acaromyces ingoldii]PWN90467.1 glycoside hydrolase [Acaromyces ingoldii]